MHRKSYPIPKLTGGLNVSVDATLITDVQSPNLQCVRFHKGIVKKDYGFTTFLDTPSAQRPMLLDSYYQLDGDDFLVLCTTVSSYRYNSGAWTVIAAATFTGDADNGFSATTMNDLFIVTNFKDAIQKWDGTTWAVLGGSPNKAKCLIPFYNYLVLGFINDSGTDCPHRIEWSDTADPEDWTGGNSGFFDINDTVDFVVGLELLGQRLFCFKERSIWEIVYVGGTRIFSPRLIIDGVGTYAKDSIISLGNELIFFGTDNIYLFDGLHIRAVGENLFPMLYETGEKLVNAGALNRARALYLEETGEYCLALPTGSDNDPSMLIKLNIKTGEWTRRYKDVSCFGLYSSSSSSIIWSAATGTWTGGNWDYPWRRQLLPPGAPTTLYAAPDGSIEVDDRSVFTSTERFIFETKDFIFEHAVKWIEVRIVCKGEPFGFAYSTNSGATWSTNVTLTPSETEFRELAFQKLNITTRKIRFRIRTWNEQIEIKWIEPWFIPRKRSKLLY